MNYPLEQLAIVAPILFIVLMVAFPLIGVFAGWKRAAYWGGGNFVFYVIGMLVWRFTSGGIVNLFAPLIQSLIPGNPDITKIAASIAAPVFFVIIFLVGNLLLLLNYYIWVKRVMGLKKYKKVKKEDPKTHKVTKIKVQVQAQHSKGYKVMNRVVGGVGMGLLMVPSTIGLTEATFFATTSASTRKNNALANNLYNMLIDFDQKVSWFSYYGKNTAKDYDALFAGLSMKSKTIDTWYNPKTGEEEPASGIDALSKTLDYGISEIVDVTLKQGGTAKEMAEAADEMVKSWNSIMESELSTDMEALFNSENATEIVKDILGIETQETLDSGEVQHYIEMFDSAIDIYQQMAKETPIKVDVSQEAYDNIIDAVVSCWEFNGDNPTQDKADMRDSVNSLLDILFK